MIVPLARIELAASGFGNQRSHPLSYKGKVPGTGVEPANTCT